MPRSRPGVKKGTKRQLNVPIYGVPTAGHPGPNRSDALFTHGLPSDVEMIPFDSSRVAAAGYSHSQRKIYVEWVDGGVPYAYSDCNAELFRRFLRSESAGRFINRILNEHPYGPVDI